MMIESEQAEHLAAVSRVRGLLARFSAAQPMMVPPTIYYELQQHPELADLMDRVRATEPIPVEPSNETL